MKRAAKSAAKSTSRRDPATKQVKAKKAAAAKKKPAPKKRAPKELTEAQKEAKKEKDAKAKITLLKKAALSPPTHRTSIAYNMFMKEHAKGFDGPGGSPSDRAESMKRQMGPIVEKWKSLSPAELEVCPSCSFDVI